VSKTLIIAEKPSLAREIMGMLLKSFDEGWNREEDYYESEHYYISSFFGHLFELCTPDEYDPKYEKWNAADLPIIPNPFRFKYKSDTQKRGKLLAGLAAKSECIINACDPDREGEGIFRIWYDCEHINKPIKRLWATSLALQDLTKSWRGIQDGSKYDSLANAQRCRMQADWLVGMNGSRAYAIASGERISIGRVQTPTLDLIVKRDAEVENFEESFFYQLVGNWNQLVFTYIEDKETKFESKERIEGVKRDCTNKPFSLKDFREERKIQNPPKPFSMPDLQREANRVFGYPLDKTLQITQKLYESKLVSYPRTDSPYLPPADLDMYYELIDLMASAEQRSVLIHKGGKVSCVKCTDSAHTAIIPTGVKPAGLSDDERNLFDLIKNRFITAFLKPRLFDQTTIYITDETHDFRAILNYTVDKGYTGISFEMDESANESDEQETRKKVIRDELNDTTPIKDLVVLSKKKAKPKYYTPATLLTAMINIGKTVDNEEDREILKEVEGIGTAATRDKIPVELQRREYIESSGKSIRSTNKGRQLIAWIQNDLKSAVLTAKWEKKLRDIEEGKFDSNEFMEGINAFITSSVKSVSSTGQMKVSAGIIAEKVQCPKCKNPLTENDKGFFCSKECGFAFFKVIAGKKISQKNTEALFKTGNSGMIDGFGKSDKSGTFAAAIVIAAPDYKPKFVFDVEHKQICLICKGKMTEFSKGIKCENPECGFIAWNEISGKKIASAQMKKLLSNGKTDKIDGFISTKNGKNFSAVLMIDEKQKKVVFNFQ